MGAPDRFPHIDRPPWLVDVVIRWCAMLGRGVTLAIGTMLPRSSWLSVVHRKTPTDGRYRDS